MKIWNHKIIWLEIITPSVKLAIRAGMAPFSSFFLVLFPGSSILRREDPAPHSCLPRKAQASLPGCFHLAPSGLEAGLDREALETDHQAIPFVLQMRKLMQSVEVIPKVPQYVHGRAETITRLPGPQNQPTSLSAKEGRSWGWSSERIGS